MREFPALVNRVIDGDTVVLDLDLGFRISYRVHCRLLDVEAPEIRGAKSEAERLAGVRVKELLERLVLGNPVRFESAGLESFCRAVGVLFIGDFDVNEAVREFIDEHSLHRVRFRSLS